MSDLVTAEERHLIEGHLASVGVSMCAPGEFSEGAASLHAGGQRAKDARKRASQRQRRFAQAGDKTRRPAPSPETLLIIEMAKTMTAREIAAKVGKKRNSISTQLRKHGVKPVSQKVRDQEAREARRAPIAAMMAEGKSAADIALKTGVSVSAVNGDVRALLKQGATRVTPKSGRKISQTSEARRALVRVMMGQGCSLAHMAECTGVSKTTIRWDVQMLQRQGAVRVCGKPGPKPKLTIVGDDAKRTDPL